MQTLISSEQLGKTLTLAAETKTLLLIDDAHLSTITVEARAHLDIILLVEKAEQAHQNLTITLGDHAIVKVWTAAFAELALNMTALLSGDNAVFEHYGLYVGSERINIGMHVTCEHTGTHTMSRTIISGIALDRSHIDIDGMIRIGLSGHQADTHFGHEGLLLSRGARIDANPGLEIGTNDVRATHSSAVHFLRPEQLFYLQTRSIAESDARRMITEGFLAASLPTLPHEQSALRITALSEIHLAKV